jgi:GNAT superfamily N-acetyltransferase
VAIDVSPVRGFPDLRAFVALPFRLHRGTPWIPPLRLERYLFLNRRLNAYFTHGEAEYFLARRDGRVAGRITAQIDAAFNEFHQNRWGMFGFLEFEDDLDVLRALLDAAAAWLRSRGCERMVGPMDFQMNDESGVLIEGYDREPMIKQPWHPPYYQCLCERIGLTKAIDLLMWETYVFDPSRVDPRLLRIAERARSRYRVRVRSMSRRHLRRELDEFARVYNAAWSRNWGFVPYSKEDLDAYALDLQLVYDRDWFMIAENDTETVAMAITIPDINQVLKKMRGRLLPLGWWYYLRRRQIIDRARIGFLGVLPEYQHTGVAAALYIEHFDMAAKTRVEQGEASWILETNRAMNRGLEAMGGRIVKRWRVYERLLEGGHDSLAAGEHVAPASQDRDPAVPQSSARIT